MKTGLTKRQKTTGIYFDEASKTVEIQTHNTAPVSYTHLDVYKRQL